MTRTEKRVLARLRILHYLDGLRRQLRTTRGIIPVDHASELQSRIDRARAALDNSRARGNEDLWCGVRL